MAELDEAVAARESSPWGLCAEVKTPLALRPADTCSHAAGVAAEEALSPGHGSGGCAAFADRRSPTRAQGGKGASPPAQPRGRQGAGSPLTALRHTTPTQALRVSLRPEDQCHWRAEPAAVPWWFPAAAGETFSQTRRGRGGRLIKGREQRVVLVASDQICIFN